MTKTIETTEHDEAFARLKEVRAEALRHWVEARRLSGIRKELMSDLLRDGFSQADIAREMGVTRQAVQKMLAAG
jgi:DNA-binding transcriptional regulator LsrR (DeoR family)